MRSFDFTSRRAYVLSVVASMFLASLLVILFVPFNKSIEFIGGALYSVTVDSDDKISSIRKDLPNVHIEKSSRDYLLKFSADSFKDKNTIESIIIKYSNIKYSVAIAPSITKSLIKKSFIAVVFSVLAVFIYIFLRFNVYYSIGAIATIIHDVIIVIALIKLLHIDLSMTTIAAVLTIIGYSVNDTVIIYDKIRENLTLHSDILETINASINKTLPRTIGTSFTTLIAILPLAIFTKDAIQDFCVIVSLGVIIGTISSIVVSALMLVPFKRGIFEIIKLKKVYHNL